MSALRLVALIGFLGCDATPSVADMAAADLAPPDDLSPVPDLAIPLRDPAAHPDPPLIYYNGGRLLRHVEAVTVVWEGDVALAAARHQFAAWMVTSSYFDQLVEYGVHRGTAVGPFVLKGPAPAVLDDAGVGPLLRAQIANGTLPPPGPDTLYLIYLPPGTTSTQSSHTGCVQYDGYHWNAATGKPSPATMAYAIMCACDTGASQFDSDTFIASHEIGEAVTDPEGSGFVDPGLPLSEVGDLCNPLSVYASAPAGDGGVGVDYRISRLWSAKTAAAGVSDPCFPAPVAPYLWFNAGMDPDQQVVTLGNARSIAATINIEPFAVGPVGLISWQVISGPNRGFIFSQTRGKGVAGSTQPITVTITSDATFGPHPIAIASQAKSYQNIWYGMIDVE